MKYFSSPAGFTLIELLIVFSIVAVISAVSIVSYSAFSKNQTFEATVSDVVNMLNTAKSRALTQVKPGICEGQTLRGYQVQISQPDMYQLFVICDTTSYPQTVKKKLPAGNTFVQNANQTVFFTVYTGVVQKPGDIVIQNNSKSKKISVTGTGIISVK